MEAKSGVPDIIVRRLPQYLRALTQLQAQHVHSTSSQELGEKLGISPAQIRKDLSQFGEFGKQGTGYSVNYLVDKLQEILNVKRVWDIALVGAGNLGHAIARYQGFTNRVLGSAWCLTRTRENGERIGDPITRTAAIKELIPAYNIHIAMIVPASAAQSGGRGSLACAIHYSPTRSC